MEVITLSSEDEASPPSPPKKRIKLQSASNNTICIDSSDDEKSSVLRENGPIKSEIENNRNKINEDVKDKNDSDQATPDADEEAEPKTEVDIIELKLSQFFEKCIEAISIPHIRERFNDVIPKVTGHYHKLKRLNCNLKDFECMLNRDKSVTYDNRMAALRFSEIFNFLKSKLKNAETDVLLSGPKRLHLKKLEKALILIRHKIRKLDEAEVNFDDEENSYYLQAAKYKERAKKIYEKMCEIRKEDPNSERPLYTKLNFDKSKYPDFNRIINKKYRNTLEFPTYYDMDKCLRKCAKIKNLNINEDTLKTEIKYCFESLGKAMKKKRKLDLYDLHCDFAKDEDPALQDDEMNNKLKLNYQEGCSKMEKIYEKYVRMQEENIKADVSSDSDDSSTVDSD